MGTCLSETGPAPPGQALGGCGAPRSRRASRGPRPGRPRRRPAGPRAHVHWPRALPWVEQTPGVGPSEAPSNRGGASSLGPPLAPGPQGSTRSGPRAGPCRRWERRRPTGPARAGPSRAARSSAPTPSQDGGGGGESPFHGGGLLMGLHTAPGCSSTLSRPSPHFRLWGAQCRLQRPVYLRPHSLPSPRMSSSTPWPSLASPGSLCPPPGPPGTRPAFLCVTLTGELGTPPFPCSHRPHSLVTDPRAHPWEVRTPKRTKAGSPQVSRVPVPALCQ